MAKNKTITFDDYRIDPDPDRANWAYVCKHCVKKHYLDPNKLDNAVPAHVTCGIQGCNNEADYYLDLPKNITNPETPTLTIPFNQIQLKPKTIIRKKGTMENEEYWQLNKRPLKLYYGKPRNSNTGQPYEPYFNWSGKRHYLKDFIRTHNNPWTCSKHYPTFIHGIKYEIPGLYIEYVNEETINIYERHIINSLN